MSLFFLPAELLRQILHFLDPASFYTCLQTSKLFREHALASTKLLHDHLSRIPGQRIIADDVSSDAAVLMKMFSKRASQHLFNGASRMADVHVWKADKNVGRKLSSIIRWVRGDEEDESTDNLRNHQELLFLVEVQANAAVINIYSANPLDDFEPESRLTISAHSLSRYLPAYDELGTNTYKIVKVVSYIGRDKDDHVGSKLAVLYCPADISAIAVLEPLRMKLLCFVLDPEVGPMVIDTYDIETNKTDIVVAMALRTKPWEADPADRKEEVFITWRDRHSYKLLSYVNNYDDLTLKRRTVEDIDSPGNLLLENPLTDRIADMSVGSNHSVHLYPATLPMPYWTMRSGFPGDGNEVTRRDNYLPDIVESFSKQSLGRVIASYHHHLICEETLNDGEPTCINTALELIISRNEASTPFGLSSRTGAFLLKAIHEPDGCDHFEMGADYMRLQHVFVAQLAGIPDLHNLSTLGIKLAVSPRSYRIAIASWRTLLVYSLDPQAFLDPDYSLCEQKGVPGDYAYIEGCGWQFYRNGYFDRECVVLEPVELSCSQVIFSMEWRNEDELWGWGEEGLCRWRIGAMATGQRGKSTLEACR